jgi:hypothetical protein
MKTTHHRTSEPSRWFKPWEASRKLQKLLAEEVGRPHFRTSNPIFAGNLEGITQALYDIYFVLANTLFPKVTMFSNPVGSVYAFGGITAFAKTYNHTNLNQAGMLEAPNKHIVRAISVYVTCNQAVLAAAGGGLVNPIDLAILQSLYCQFNVNRKPYQDTIIGRLPSGGGIEITGATAAPAGIGGTATNGWPIANNTYTLAHGGVALEQAQNFNFIIDPTQASASQSTSTAAAGGYPSNGIGAWVFFDGTLFRAVQ